MSANGYDSFLTETIATHSFGSNDDGRGHDIHRGEVPRVVTTTQHHHRGPEIHHHHHLPPHHLPPPTVWPPSEFGGESPTVATGGIEIHKVSHGFGVNRPSIDDNNSLNSFSCSLSSYGIDMVLTRSKRSLESKEGASVDEPHVGNIDGMELPMDAAADTAQTLITLYGAGGDSEGVLNQGDGGGTSQLLLNRGDVGGLSIPPVKMHTMKKTKSSQPGSIGKLLFLMPDMGDGGGLGRILKVTPPHEHMSNLYKSLLGGELSANVYREHDGIFEFGDETFLVAIQVARADLSVRGLCCELNDPVHFQNCLEDFHAVIANFRFMTAK